MLFEEEFTKQVTATVEQVKAIKKLNIPEEKKGLFSFRVPPPKLSSRLQGWLQEWPFKIPAIQKKREQPTSPQPHRKQSRTKEQLTHTIVNCQNVIISCHLTLDLNVALPSIKRGILTSLHVTSLHAGRIKEFKENWPLLTQDPWVLQTVQGFQLPLVAQPVQVTVPPQM